MACLSTENYAHRRLKFNEHPSHRCLGGVVLSLSYRCGWDDRRHTSLLDLDEDLVLSDWREKTPRSESRTSVKGERSKQTIRNGSLLVYDIIDALENERPVILVSSHGGWGLKMLQGR